MNIMVERKLTGNYTNYILQITDKDIVEAKSEDELQMHAMWWLFKLIFSHINFTPPVEPPAAPPPATPERDPLP